MILLMKHPSEQTTDMLGTMSSKTNRQRITSNAQHLLISLGLFLVEIDNQHRHRLSRCIDKLMTNIRR